MRNGWRGLFAWHTCQKTANLGGREFIIAASDEYATWKPDWFSNLVSQQVFLFESGDETWLASSGIQGPVIFLQFFAFVLTSIVLTSWSVASYLLRLQACAVTSWVQSPYIKKTVTPICVGTPLIINKTFVSRIFIRPCAKPVQWWVFHSFVNPG